MVSFDTFFSLFFAFPLRGLSMSFSRFLFSEISDLVKVILLSSCFNSFRASDNDSRKNYTLLKGMDYDYEISK